MRSRTARPDVWRKQLPKVLGPLLTLLVLVVVEVSAATVESLRLLSPASSLAFALFAVVYAAFAGGLLPGLVSAALVIGYAAFFFSTPGDPFHYTEDALRRLFIFAVVIPGVAILVGGLKRRADAAARQALLKEQEHAASLAATNRSLAKANEALEAFTYVVSHDLKEPVRAIEAYLRAMEEDHGPTLSPDARNLLLRSRTSTEQLSSLLQGLLDYSRASRTDLTSLQPLRVEEALASQSCRTRYESVLAERGGRLLVEGLREAPAVLATTPALCQVLGNLVVNAVKHNPAPAPVVKVVCRQTKDPGRFLEVVVEDNGPGFPPSVLELFYQEASEGGLPSSVRGGSGFGLVIARRAVERLGGALWAGYTEEGGAAVHFTLPRADEGPRRRPLPGTGPRHLGHDEPGRGQPSTQSPNSPDVTGGSGHRRPS